MGTKTVDGTETGAEAKKEEVTADAVKTDDERAEERATDEVTAENTETDGEEPAHVTEEAGPSGVGQGAGAVVSAALGLVGLTGGWVGTVAAARATLIGQLQTSSGAPVAKQIKAVYGDAWHATALWGGLFALVALVTGVVVLARPAFGAPGKPQAAWIKSVAWAGVSLGVIGLLLAVLKYSDALLALPTAG
ncbi:hypothetical protein [Streptomyces sp. NPDC001843]|uniref:hypothetical protein n=1 Tax=Streptomyces sp. NPDC001843 TaxID=3364617 RepID=UPI0036924BF2